MRVFLMVALTTFAAPANAFSCLFETECYETEPCAPTDFTLDVDIEGKEISSVSGDLTIVAVKTTDEVITLFATGGFTEFLMSVTPDAARLSAQINNGPQVIGYMGQCEGAF